MISSQHMFSYDSNIINYITFDHVVEHDKYNQCYYISLINIFNKLYDKQSCNEYINNKYDRRKE